jgi:hypothetical protein
MTMNKLDAIDMTRRIRDALYEQIKDKTLSERLAFYRDQAQEVHRRLGLPPPATPPVESDSVPAPAINDEDQRHR